MIYDALLVPKEEPPTLRELKRALLTYDKVVLVDPNDRDIMPSDAFMSAIMGIPLFGMDMGAVRPMGKIFGYDEQFAKTVESARTAIAQGLIEVRSTYQKASTGQMTIGAVLTGGYPLNTQFVFRLYRAMAADQGFLVDAVQQDSATLARHLVLSPELALSGTGDGGINEMPALPQLDLLVGGADVRSALSNIARSRIGAFIKYSGYCEAKTLVPVLPSNAYGGIAQRLLNNARETFAAVDDDRYWSKRNRVLELCHEEYLIDHRLDNLSVDEVIGLRTKAWGRQAAAREGLFASIFELAKEIDYTPEFSTRVLPQIREYRKASEELVLEREQLSFELKCDLGAASLAGGAALAGLLSQLESPVASIGLTLAAGGMWAFDKAKGYVPALRKLRASDNEMKRGAGFGLHDFYSRLGKG